jgi:hypothetical protein
MANDSAERGHARPEVPLTWREVRLAAFAGIERAVMDRANGLAQPLPTRPGQWHTDVIGSLGEYVVAKALGVWWAGAMPAGAADVATWEVRATDIGSGGLIVRPKDPTEANYVLVLARRMPVFVIAGWLPGSEAKVERYWQADEPGFWLVPQQDLWDWETRPF